MSSVLERFRKPSKFQPITDARDLRAKVMVWSLNENNIPKRKRALFLQDLKNITNSIVDNVMEASQCYPRSKSALEERKAFIDSAIRSCYGLFYEFQFIDDVQGVNLNKLADILELNEKLALSLKKWRSSNKVASDDKSVR